MPYDYKEQKKENPSISSDNEKSMIIESKKMKDLLPKDNESLVNSPLDNSVSGVTED